jgi:hypothetical protein
VANKKDFITPRIDIKVPIELLGDACGIFKKNKVQRTSIVLKTIYNTSGLKQEAFLTIDEILYQCGVNNVEKCTLLVLFYGGRQVQAHIEEKLPTLATVMSELMSKESLEVDGVKYTFKVTFGGTP